jgi:CHAT domain-containing protein/Tfp pilus assembly protein PilF
MIKAEDYKTLRRYLLGEITEPAQLARIEESLLTDDDYFEALGVTADELIDQYLGDELSRQERIHFERHYLSTPERWAKLRFTQTLREYNSARRVEEPVTAEGSGYFSGWRRWLLNPVGAVACVLILIAAGLLTWRVFYRESDVDKGLVALRTFYRSGRPIEARISGFDYAPLYQTRGNESDRSNSAEVERAQRILLDAVHDDPNPDSHHALGQFYLAQKEFDKAAAEFREALQAAPADPRLHSDLGAALLEKAKVASDRPEGGEYLQTLAESLEHLNQALALDSSLREALFNKALCLQYMMMPNQAKETWQKYLQLDAQSPWAGEARRNLRSLEEQSSVAQTPEQVLESFFADYRRRDDEQAWQTISRNREMITGRMVTFHLATKLLAADAEGRADISAVLTYAGALEEERTGDPYFAQLAAYYAAARPDARRLMTEAHQELAQGYALCQQAEYEEAFSHFLRAQQLFVQADDGPETKLVDYWLAYCHCRTDKMKESAARLENLINYSELRGYKWLRSQALCLLANCYDLLGEHSRSISHNRKALAIAEAIADTYNQQKLLTQIALQYTQLGQFDQALAYNQRSLLLARDGSSSVRQTWRNFTFTSQTLCALKAYAAAAAYEAEALQLGLGELKDPTLIHLSHIHLGMIYAARQLYDEAAAELDASLRVARTADDGQARQRMVAYSTLQLAHLKRQTRDYAGALKLYDAAQDLYGPLKFDIDTYDLHKGRLLCDLMGGDDSTIQAEIARVMSLFERNRARILEEQSRNSFFDAEQSVYDLAIDYAFSRQHYRQAFEYSEASRSRSLLDLLRRKVTPAPLAGESWQATSQPPSFDIPAIQAALPPNVQLLQYNVLRDKLLIWVITGTRFEVVERKISADELTALALRYAALLSSIDGARDAEAAQVGRALYEITISPVAHLLSREQEVCIIPDKALFYLPFAALISPSTGEYLLKDYTLLFSPSASVLILCSEAARRKAASGPETFVGIGNPTFDRAAYPNLADLPTAGFEVRKAADNYDGVASCLTGPAALKRAVEAKIESADVIHFACHYITDEVSPMNSRLLLAKGGNETGDESVWTLSAQEMSNKWLQHAKLVVLSACQTGGEHYYNGEGMIGIARMFMAAGAPLVVATQWPVETGATAELMINFHQLRRRQGLSTTQALRQAQLEMLDGSDQQRRRPYYWATFLPIGGHTDY